MSDLVTRLREWTSDGVPVPGRPRLLMAEAADEIDRLRLELKAIEQLADPLGPSPGDLIRLLGRMAHKALQ